MKLVIEIDPDSPEEIRIRAKRSDERLQRLREVLDRELSGPGEIVLKKGEAECFVSPAEILFAETAGEKVWVHTAGEVYLWPGRLWELERLLPRGFARAGKGCLVNTLCISSIARSPTGVGEASFFSGEKKAFISRMYYKIVRDVIEEVRLKK